MGPGRWGSRGDIKLGVSVTYSDINNTAVLIEIAREAGQLRPGPLVRHALLPGPRRSRPSATCRSSPTTRASCSTSRSWRSPRTSWPTWCRSSRTWLARSASSTCPGHRRPGPARADERRPGRRRRLPGESGGRWGAASERKRVPEPASPEDHWRWRLRMAERIAAAADAERFGIKGLYVFGSTKNATAGPAATSTSSSTSPAPPEKRRNLAGLARGLEPLPLRDELPADRRHRPTACSTSTSSRTRTSRARRATRRRSGPSPTRRGH